MHNVYLLNIIWIYRLVLLLRSMTISLQIWPGYPVQPFLYAVLHDGYWNCIAGRVGYQFPDRWVWCPSSHNWLKCSNLSFLSNPTISHFHIFYLQFIPFIICISVKYFIIIQTNWIFGVPFSFYFTFCFAFFMFVVFVCCSVCFVFVCYCYIKPSISVNFKPIWSHRHCLGITLNWQYFTLGKVLSLHF